MRTITLSKSLGIQAVIGELPNDPRTRVQTLMFNITPNIQLETGSKQTIKAWNLRESKEWVKAHKDRIKISINLKELLQKCRIIVEKGVQK